MPGFSLVCHFLLFPLPFPLTLFHFTPIPNSHPFLFSLRGLFLNLYSPFLSTKIGVPYYPDTGRYGPARAFFLLLQRAFSEALWARIGPYNACCLFLK